MMTRSQITEHPEDEDKASKSDITFEPGRLRPAITATRPHIAQHSVLGDEGQDLLIADTKTNSTIHVHMTTTFTVHFSYLLKIDNFSFCL
jgi:hypothetical protein